MNKKRVIKAVSDISGIKKKKINEMADYVFKVITDIIVINKIVVINNFGEFRLIKRNTRIIKDKNDVYIVIPPSNVIIFNLFKSEEHRKNSMNSEEIINRMMIKFSINDEDATMIFKNIFSTVRDFLLKGKKFKAGSFGEFQSVKLNSKDRHAEVIFKSSGKLKAKTNYEFENLKVCRIYIQKPEVFEEKEQFEFEITEEFKSKLKDLKENEFVQTTDIESETVKISNNLKRLISEELLKLHREITDLGLKTKQFNEVNLWK